MQHFDDRRQHFLQVLGSVSHANETEKAIQNTANPIPVEQQRGSLPRGQPHGIQTDSGIPSPVAVSSPTTLVSSVNPGVLLRIHPADHGCTMTPTGSTDGNNLLQSRSSTTPYYPEPDITSQRSAYDPGHTFLVPPSHTPSYCSELKVLESAESSAVAPFQSNRKYKHASFSEDVPESLLEVDPTLVRFKAIRSLEESPVPLLSNKNIKFSTYANHGDSYLSNMPRTTIPHLSSNMCIFESALTASSQFDRANIPSWHAVPNHDSSHQEQYNLPSNTLITQLTKSNQSARKTGLTTSHRGTSSPAYTLTSARVDDTSDLTSLTQLWFHSHITNLSDALKHMPLEELGKQPIAVGRSFALPQYKIDSWNLVKIENIPYNLDDEMLLEFLGRTPGLVPEEYGGIHGKTMDCFLEFLTVGGAERFVQWRYNNNRRCILGGRHISLELVPERELMAWLFPKTRGLLWDDTGSLIVDESCKSSKAQLEIISREELVMILGHARTPHRSPFSRKCLQRPYESLMSVITKFPWRETEFYTLKQRDLIFQAAFEAGELLKRQILKGKAGPNIDLKLLRRLCRTISFCPGFTYRQKLTFLDAMGIDTTECVTILGDLGISHPLATQFQALTVRPGADYIAVEAIANLVADGVLNPNNPQVRDTEEFLTAPGFEPTMRAAAEIELERVYSAITMAFVLHEVDS
ncbi:hypothetical protein TWF694_002205 [Orbilia ellipsospora]|uniref:Uncharacterized protein n=1 Tax=Orbilia ellipsospora TaxID=2528407 RepID=A0AAV9X195_9PEZI